MQQILNSQDRNQAFLKFLLFFIITVILVITAIYFNYRVPVKDNKYLQNELEVQRMQDANQAKFVAKMEEAVDLLDSLDKPGTNIDLTAGLINSIITDMNKMTPAGSKTIYSRMDKAIWSQFDELRRTKVELLKGKGNADQITKLESNLRNCNSDNAQLQRDYNDLKKSTQ